MHRKQTKLIENFVTGNGVKLAGKVHLRILERTRQYMKGKVYSKHAPASS